MSDYKKGKIYKITNDFNNDIYVGSTCDTLIKRFSNHKRKSNVDSAKERPLYKLINEVGFERFRIQLIEEFPCEDKYQLRQREGYFIREIGTLNKSIASRTCKEYTVDNFHVIKEYKKQYAIDHQEHIKKYKQEYYLQNKEQIQQKKRNMLKKRLFVCVVII